MAAKKPRTTKRKTSATKKPRTSKTVIKKVTKAKQRPSRPSKPAVEKIKQSAKNNMKKKTGADHIIGDQTEDSLDKSAAIDIAAVQPESADPDYTPGSLAIEDNEKLLKLEHNAKVKSDGTKHQTTMDDQTRAYLGQLVWYWRTKGLTYDKIAQKYKLSFGLLHRVYEEYLAGIREFMNDSRENHISMELARIDDMLFAFLPYVKEHETEQVFTRRYGEKMLVKKVIVKTPPSVEYGSFILKLMERRARLLGLDAPSKQEIEETINFVIKGPAKSQDMTTWAQEGGVTIEHDKESKSSSDIKRH